MASDYVREFADRRQIVLPAPAHEPIPARRSVEPVHVRPTAELIRETVIRKSEPPPLSNAVTRHAKIVQAMRFAHSVGDAYTADQRAELMASRASLDTIRPHAAVDLEAAFSNDQGRIDAAAQGRISAVIQAMQLESDLRVDPQLRADTFVQRWQALDRQRRALMRDYEDTKAGKVAQTMLGMAKGLERDPQVESLLRIRKAELGIGALPSRSVGESLADLVGSERSRGIDTGM